MHTRPGSTSQKFAALRVITRSLGIGKQVVTHPAPARQTEPALADTVRSVKSVRSLRSALECKGLSAGASTLSMLVLCGFYITDMHRGTVEERGSIAGCIVLLYLYSSFYIVLLLIFLLTAVRARCGDRQKQVAVRASQRPLYTGSMRNRTFLI